MTTTLDHTRPALAAPTDDEIAVLHAGGPALVVAPNPGLVRPSGHPHGMSPTDFSELFTD